ncbi:MAG: alpha-amylase [Bacteroides sp.]|nr:alpha-amylase [Bacteroides sp.]
MRIRNVLFSIGLLPLLCACGAKQQSYTLPAPEDVVMYQVNPRVFAPVASFDAVGNYLDSIRQLGVNVVWFMPINEVGKEKSVNSPYCVKDYKSVNPEFGTVEEFKRLVDRCHEKGLSVIIDWVANHTSWDNAWMEHKDWYTQDDNGNVVSPANTGWDDVADLNFDNQEMRLAMIDAMKFWVSNIGVDGFRCDAADFVPYDFWKQALDSLRAIPGHPLLMLAEGKRKDHFTAGFDMNYAWDFLEGTREVFRKDSCAFLLFDVDRMEYDSLSSGKVKLRFTTNHDEMVKMSPVREFGNERGAMAAFVLSTYLHGGALIYGSQEVGYQEPIDFFRYCPIDWHSNPALRAEFKMLMRLYNEYPAIRKGELKTYPDCNVLVF